jgi:hypothetical protein
MVFIDHFVRPSEIDAAMVHIDFHNTLASLCWQNGLLLYPVSLWPWTTQASNL